MMMMGSGTWSGDLVGWGGGQNPSVILRLEFSGVACCASLLAPRWVEMLEG